MKFEEKLVKLRKENLLSQEELGEKLNVTRQTISKWELGETKPDSAKILEIARLFNVSTDALLNESNEETDPINEQYNNIEQKSAKKNNNPWLIILLIIVVIGSILFLIGKYLEYKAVESAGKNLSGIFSSFSKIFDNNDNTDDKAVTNGIEGVVDSMLDSYNSKVEEMDNDFEKSTHNNAYEMYAGVQSKFFTNNVINSVIQDNSKGEHKVTIKYKDKEYSDNSDISNLSLLLKDNGKYLITFNYDENGFINEVVLEDNGSQGGSAELSEHNSKYEDKIGVQRLLYVEEMINDIIQSNSKSEHKIVVKYNDKVYSDVKEIAGIVSKLDAFKNYLITCNYDEEGFVNEVVIDIV